ncbi:MAG: hypothetical protein ACREXJ_06715 [Gammaproteobacteria bacterium]
MQPEPALHVSQPLFARFEQPTHTKAPGFSRTVAYGIDCDVAVHAVSTGEGGASSVSMAQGGGERIGRVGRGYRIEPQQNFTMCWTWALSARPGPTMASLISAVFIVFDEEDTHEGRGLTNRNVLFMLRKASSLSNTPIVLA